MKYFPERYEQEVEKVVKYPRWLLAHGLELGYDELCEIESAEGVEIITNKGSMGRYATAGGRGEGLGCRRPLQGGGPCRKA